jgi:alcohol dehydrogenase class IV
MQPFEFFSVPRIVFGRGEVRRLGSLAKSFGSRPLVVYNGGGAALQRVEEVLGAEGLRVQSVRQRGEPTVADVERAVAAAREGEHDVLVGLGGGSAIDCAKATAGVLANGGSPLDYMEVIGAGRPLIRPATPWIAVPTTAGTGAEVTRNAVIGDPSRKFKASLRSELLLPRVALVDPELGVSVPPDVTAASGMDALCQLVESYTSTNANDMTHGLSVGGIGHVARSLQTAYEDGTNLDAREGMALAALRSGICLTNAGLGAVHGLAAPLGANFPVPHGVVCAALLPHVTAANIQGLRAESPEHPALRKYSTTAHLLGRYHGIDAVAAFAKLVEVLRIPRLRQFGVTGQHVPEMVALARKASSMRYNPVVLSDEALAGVLRAAI